MDTRDAHPPDQGKRCHSQPARSLTTNCRVRGGYSTTSQGDTKNETGLSTFQIPRNLPMTPHCSGGILQPTESLRDPLGHSTLAPLPLNDKWCDRCGCHHQHFSCAAGLLPTNDVELRCSGLGDSSLAPLPLNDKWCDRCQCHLHHFSCTAELLSLNDSALGNLPHFPTLVVR